MREDINSKSPRKKAITRDIIDAESHASVTKYRDCAGLVLFKYSPYKEFACNISVTDDFAFAKERIIFYDGCISVDQDAV